jgi:protein involved in polysaccharide export with SLBB domain
VYVLSNASNRASLLASLVDNIKTFRVQKHVDKHVDKQVPILTYPKTARVYGEVKYSGEYPIVDGMDAQALVVLAGGLQPDAQKNLVMLAERTDKAGRFDIRYVPLGDTTSRPQLKPGVRIYVLSNTASRGDLFAPLISEINAQSWHGDRLPLVTVNNAVRFPATYPYMAGSTAGDLIALAGGLREEAYSMFPDHGIISLSLPDIRRQGWSPQ